MTDACDGPEHDNIGATSVPDLEGLQSGRLLVADQAVGAASIRNLVPSTHLRCRITEIRPAPPFSRSAETGRRPASIGLGNRKEWFHDARGPGDAGTIGRSGESTDQSRLIRRRACQGHKGASEDRLKHTKTLRSGDRPDEMSPRGFGTRIRSAGGDLIATSGHAARLAGHGSYFNFEEVDPKVISKAWSRFLEGRKAPSLPIQGVRSGIYQS